MSRNAQLHQNFDIENVKVSAVILYHLDSTNCNIILKILNIRSNYNKFMILSHTTASYLHIKLEFSQIDYLEITEMTKTLH